MFSDRLAEIYLSAYLKLSKENKNQEIPEIDEIVSKHLIPFISSICKYNSMLRENLVTYSQFGNENWESLHFEQMMKGFHCINQIFTSTDLIFLLGRGSICTFQFYLHVSMEEKITIFLEIIDALLWELRSFCPKQGLTEI